MFSRILTAALVLGVVGILAVPSVAKADDAATYRRHCEKCHAVDGSGKKKDGKWLPVAKGLKLDDPSGLSIISAKAKALSDEAIKKSMTVGKGKMKPMTEKMSAKEIDAMVKYTRKLQRK